MGPGRRAVSRPSRGAFSVKGNTSRPGPLSLRTDPGPEAVMNTIRRTLAATLVLGLAAPAAMAELNDRPPNARDQSPAFPGQTRAPEIHQDIPIARSTLIRGLDSPWGMALLPDGGLLITERSGGLRLFRGCKLSDPGKGLAAGGGRRPGRPPGVG